MAVEAVDSAAFLTPSEKRDIFYGNAVRFLRLDQVSERKTP
jgi:predicted TIM-barrel fold metal-dependent hydrolase